MTGDSDHVRRRTVLRSALAGATAVAGLGTVGTAAASSFRVGEPVTITLDNQSYLDACPNDGYGPIYEAGQDGTVWDICTTDGGTDMILFQPNDYNQDRGWVNEQYLE